MSETAEAVAPEATNADVQTTPEVPQEGQAGDDHVQAQDGIPGDGQEQVSEDAGGSEGTEAADPASYELTAPEGFEINEDLRGTLNEFAGKHKLSQEAMQEAVNLHSQMVRQMQTQMVEQAESRQAENIKAIKSMKEMAGGEGLEANVGQAVAGIDNLQNAVNGIFGDDAIELRKHFHENGIGNDPAVMQMMYAYAKTMKVMEDSTLAGVGHGGPASPRDRVDVLYGNS